MASSRLRTTKIAGRRIVTAEALDELLGEASSTEMPGQVIAGEHLAARTPAHRELPPALIAHPLVAPVATARRSLPRAPPCHRGRAARRIKSEEGAS
jgi:hypothetical protein